MTNLEKLLACFLHLTNSLCSTGKVVILDSGFCVLQGILELRKKGVYVGALIKKRRYWPRHMPGDSIDAHFKEKEVGDTDALNGTMDGVDYNIFGMKRLTM